jgi:hypothetical protein
MQRTLELTEQVNQAFEKYREQREQLDKLRLAAQGTLGGEPDYHSGQLIRILTEKLGRYLIELSNSFTPERVRAYPDSKEG